MAPSVRRPALFSVAILLLSCLSVRPVSAQTAEGRVVDDRTDRPVSGAVVRLMDADGEPVRATVADSAGAYRLDAPGAGGYALEAEGLGYETRRSSAFRLESAGDTVSMELRLALRPVPIPGVEVATDQVNRRLRGFLGMSPGQLRIRPIRREVIQRHASRGDGVSQMMEWAQVTNLRVLRSREGPCFQYRGRGCLAVYLDGARLRPRAVGEVPLEMLSTAVVLLPSESVSYPEGAVHLFTVGFMR